MSGQITPPGLHKVTTDASLSGDGTSGNPLGGATNGIGNSQIRQSVARSVVGRSANSTGNVGDIQASADGQFLQQSGSALTWAAIPNNYVTNAMLAQAAATTVKGNATNGTANVSDIAASADGQVLVRTGGTLAWSGIGGVAFGDGFDGSLHYDGSTTILGVAPSSNTYSLSRDVLASSITVDTGVTIKLNGYRIFCTGVLTLTGSASINDDGNPGVGNAAGTARSAGFYAANAGGGAASSALPNPYGSTQAAAAAGTNGGRLQGAGGGTGTNPASTGGATTVQVATVGVITYDDWVHAHDNGTSATVISYGSGGGNGGTGGGGQNGGGGAGGGIAFVAARVLAGTGTITAKGGNGSNATGATGNQGGGGGGGGGFVIVTYVTNGGVTFSAAGGTHGNGAASGGNGGDGGAGYVIKYNLSGDGT